MLVGGDQKAGGAGGGVIDRLADLRIHQIDDGADDVARRAELAEFAGLLDLAQHMLEQIALGVGVGLFQPQLVDQRHDLGQHGRLVDREARLRHEAHAEGVADAGEEREHLVAHEGDQLLAGHGVGPGRPAHPLARNGLDALGRRVQRIAQRPVAGEQAGVVAGRWLWPGADWRCRCPSIM